MKILKVLWIVMWLALSGAAWAVEHLTLADATPGRTGICVTEMGGGERVEIPLTVLGSVGSGTPDGEIVLVRLDDPRFEKTGIIAGMSGSPVYLDGKLLGALAFGWSFSKDPIGGVTPFERMLEIETSPMSAAVVDRRPRIDELIEAMASGTLGRTVVDWLVPERAGRVHPLPMSVTVGGWWAPTEGGWLAESWRRMGWIATPGGGPVDPDAGRDITPGAMVAAVMVDGDVTVAGAGTVTEVRGDRLWAFGHPSLGAGATNMPLARAKVVAVLPSLMNSFKFFSVGKPIGALVADRTPGVVGILGRDVPMIPVRVSVNDRRYSFRAIRHPTLLPLLAGYLSQASHGSIGRTFGDQTLTTRIELQYQDHPVAVATAAFTGGFASGEAAAFVSAVVAYIENSAFAVPEIESVDIRLESVEEIRSATIVEILPERREVRPGEDLAVRFRLRKHRGGEEFRTLTLHIPEGIPDGRIDVVGGDGVAWTAYDQQMRPLEPSTFGDEVRLLNGLVPANTLVVALEARDLGMVVPGGTVSAPPSMVLQLRSVLGPNLQTTAYGVFAKTMADVPFPVTGAQRVPLTVRSKEWKMEKQ
jgi:hypothetical protein